MRGIESGTALLEVAVNVGMAPRAGCIALRHLGRRIEFPAIAERIGLSMIADLI